MDDLQRKRACVEDSECLVSSVKLPPQSKRLRIEGPRLTNDDVTNCVFRRSMELLDYLNVDEVLNAQLIPSLTFLTADGSQKLIDLKINTSQRGSVQQLLYFVKSHEGEEGRYACRKLVACIIMTKENHRGHNELAKIFSAKLPLDEWRYCEQLAKESNETPMPSPYKSPEAIVSTAGSVQPSPERPVPLIALQGMLAEKLEFGSIEDDLWSYFSVGDYKTPDATVMGVLRDKSFKVEVDCQIVAMWFKSLIIMHQGGKYSSAIKVLIDALEMCGYENCVNNTILEGRIYQRIAQNHLMLGQTEPALKYFELAKDKLQMVGRGYDKANMYCREAKILTALEPDNRAKVEEMFELALSALEQTDSFFLASFPSITLSKAGFFLRVSFGSKATDNPPEVDPADVRKAEDTLRTIDESQHILLEMRKFEYNFLRAELCRLQGRDGEAREMFQVLISTPGSSKVKNILSLAKQRMKIMESHSGLPVAEPFSQSLIS